ncbi:MAG TPA: S41 family peptidase [Candidatus Kapabacteria bacterium]|jgi:carboxyl-terminal processing protease|nr:S41 family peptidase [Candidatus Kapabacteria bacterium]
MKSRRKMWFTVIGLVVGIIVGIRIEPLISGDNIYEQIRKFNDVLSIVQKNYVDDVDTEKLVESAINGMLNQLDPHSIYLPAEKQKSEEEKFSGNYEGIGIEFDVLRDTITVISPISGGPSAALGILAGDRIVKIDDKNAVGISREDVPKRLKGPKGTQVKVTVVRTGSSDPIVFDIKRDRIPMYTVDASFVDENGTGYVRINRFGEQTYREMMTSLDRLAEQGMKQLVLDLRYNPGGYMQQAIRIADEFIPGGKKLLYTKSERRGVEDEFMSEDGQRWENIPLIVLLNSGSASASEIVAGAVQDLDRGLVVGETSFGKGLVQLPFPLSDGSAVRVTVSRYYTPSGRLIQRPYKDGDEYYREAYTRDEEEGNNTDHAHDATDTTRPVHRTASGRKVLGGGGITPDYIVKPDTIMQTSVDIFRKNVFTEYIDRYMRTSQTELKSRYGTDSRRFMREFQISAAQMADFLKLAKEKGVDVKTEQIAADETYLKNTLKSRIARVIFGDNEATEVALADDKQYRKATSLFPEALRISKLTQR